jgi:pimeloyl-ACP methyl ester carboxylesterase
VRELRVEAGGCELVASVDGDGPPLMLLHGQLGTASDFANWRLASDFTTIAPDIRGRGRSVCTDRHAYTWERYADDVVALLDAAGVAKGSLLGVSMGAGIAIATALRHPGRVQSLVLFMSPYAGRYLDSQLPRQLATLTRAEAILRGEHVEMPARWKAHDPMSIALALVGIEWRQPLESPTELVAVTHPTLVVPGADDLHPPEVADVYLAHMPDARLGVADLAAIRRFASGWKP